MKEVFIFDIDGCVLPAIFPNFNEESVPRENIIREVLEKGNDIPLYSEFVEFYQKRSKRVEYIFFLTGRKESELGPLTEAQLKPLRDIRDFRVIFYPEEKNHIAEEYFSWKKDEIKKIFDEYRSSPKRSEIIFKIFDDMTDYFDEINRIAEEVNMNILLKHIKRPEDWKHI